MQKIAPLSADNRREPQTEIRLSQHSADPQYIYPGQQPREFALGRMITFTNKMIRDPKSGGKGGGGSGDDLEIVYAERRKQTTFCGEVG